MKSFSNASGVIHFIGVGGIGMSGIADVLINMGYKVTGSDLKKNTLTEKLARKGAQIFIGHDKNNVCGASVVVVSSAVAKNNPEVREARKQQIPVVKRVEMLSELMRMKRSIAIAGTHGKTTTTSLVAAILDQANADPTVINGGVINAYSSNARLGSGDWIIVEADESDGSFTKLMSTISVVTNIDLDHVDNFKDISELTSMFLTFVENIPFYGTAVLCADHPEVRKIASKIFDRKIITYGFADDADVCAKDLKFTSAGTEFDVIFSQNFIDKNKLKESSWKNVALSMFGKHNVQNSLGAISVALELGISQENIRIALGAFMGVRRRFTPVGTVNGVSIIDDYAHHPVEIEAALNAARNFCFGKIYAIMQLHRYTRLEKFLDEFAKSLELSDYALVTPVYSAGEASNNIDHFSLLEKIKSNNKVYADFAADVADVWNNLSKKTKPGDIVIFLGAGDITQWAYTFSDIANADASEKSCDSEVAR